MLNSVSGATCLPLVLTNDVFGLSESHCPVAYLIRINRLSATMANNRPDDFSRWRVK
jgi:hypothetical protein